MKRLIIVLAMVAAVVAACKKSSQQDTTQALVSLSADNAFATDGSATVTLQLSSAMSTVCKVTLGVGATAQDGKLAIAQSDISFESNPVTILMNKDKVAVKVNVDKNKMKKNSQAVITIEATDGVKAKQGEDVVYIDWTGPEGNSGEDNTDSEDPSYSSDDPSSSEDPSSSKDPSSSDDPSPSPEPTPGWKVEYEGYMEVEFEDGADMTEVIKTSGNGIEDVYVYIADEGYFDSFDGDVSAFLEDAVAWFNQEVTDYADYGWTPEDLIISTDPGYVYYDQFDPGVYEVFMVGMDTDGDVSGKWTMSTFEIEEEPFEITLTRVEDWKPYYVGRYFDEDEDDYFDRFAVDWDLDTFFSIEVLEPGTVEEEGLEAIAKDSYEYYYGYYDLYTAIYDDVSLGDLLSSSDYNYMDYYTMDAGEYEVVVLEYDAECNLTGRYNLETVTVDGNIIEISEAPALRKALLKPHKIRRHDTPSLRFRRRR